MFERWGEPMQKIANRRVEPLGAIAVLAMAAVVPSFAQDKQTMQEIENRLSKAILSGDGKAAAALYTDDATLLPPGIAPVTGREAIQEFWTKRGPGLSELQLTTVEVRPMGADYAREIGLLAGKTSGSEPKSFTGKYVLIFQKVGSTWLATTDAWSRD
jgi:uncharacterized protein (TIGR02246 family)